MEGGIGWRRLYDTYPSHGTNTFWLDRGNYLVEPSVPMPRFSPMRIYRIVNKGTNTGTAPFVLLTAPTNNAILSDQVTVSVISTSSVPFINIRLFVDGEEMDRSEDDTNFVINTCEWPNGPHTLFATASATSMLPGPNGDFPITIGRAVSPSVSVVFSNLVTKVAFSEAFFEPSLGQTQQVTAAFAANVDWTLNIIDESSNAVRTVTGSGTSLNFNWDGTGDGGTNIADGVYYYVISAATNGQAFGASGGGSGGESGGPPSPSSASGWSSESEGVQWLAMPADGSGAAVPLMLYPPGADTNGLVIFEGSMGNPETTSLSSASSMEEESGFGPLAFSGAAAQTTTAPTRPPTSPVKNVGSTPQNNNYAIAYYSWPTNESITFPKNGQPPQIATRIHMDGCGNCISVTAPSLEGHAENTAAGMIQAMKKLGWKMEFEKHDFDLPAQKIRRNDQNYNGDEIFTQATIGLFMDHGGVGDDPDYSAGSSGSLLTYFASCNPADTGDNKWIRMCQFGFGGNLKWMCILACNALADPNYGDMVNHGAIPLKTTHLLCGGATEIYMDWDIGDQWAKNMIKKKQTIVSSWFDAGDKRYHRSGGITNTVIFRVTGYPECMDDTIATNTTPTSPSPNPGTLDNLDRQVYP
jgi:hypothetical protein